MKSFTLLSVIIASLAPAITAGPVASGREPQQMASIARRNPENLPVQMSVVSGERQESDTIKKFIDLNFAATDTFPASSCNLVWEQGRDLKANPVVDRCQSLSANAGDYSVTLKDYRGKGSFALEVRLGFLAVKELGAVEYLANVQVDGKNEKLFCTENARALCSTAGLDTPNYKKNAFPPLQVELTKL